MFQRKKTPKATKTRTGTQTATVEHQIPDPTDPEISFRRSSDRLSQDSLDNATLTEDTEVQDTQNHLEETEE